LIPRYKIETYTGAVLDYTIEKDATVYAKNVVTESVGNFNLVLPTVKGTADDFIYDDIALNDTVKIYFWLEDEGSCPATPNFVGKVGKISAPLTVENGYVRQISGLSLGEVLLRRFKVNKYYDAAEADDIVADVATDLGLGAGEIAVDTTAVTLEIKTKTYFDILKAVSDYWASAGVQIKKDFYVDINNNLVWKSRPIRTAGVETLTVGDNIKSYIVTTDVDSVRNSITVYGFAEKALPVDKDAWTEALTNWTATAGTLALNDSEKKTGTYSIQCTLASGGTIGQFHRTFNRVTIRDINQLTFWFIKSSPVSDITVRLLAPDSSNYFYDDTLTLSDVWEFYRTTLGPNNEYNAVANPNGIWKKTGSPNWWDIQAIEFYFTKDSGYAGGLYVDGLFFFPDRWTYTASDATSITAYEQWDMEVTDDKLHSDSDCEKRAKTLLYQLKDPPTQIEVITPLNTNILVGDRLIMTIPAEGINTVNYDVISVEHIVAGKDFETHAIMVNSASTRESIVTTPVKELANIRKNVNRLGAGLYRVR